MSLRLIVIDGPDRGLTFALAPDQTLLVGRGKAAPARLSDPRVSRKHCRVQAEGDRARVVDAGSVAGTLVNGRRVEESRLRPGDVLQVGDTRLRLEWQDEDDADTRLPAAAPRAPALRAERLHELTGTRLSGYEVGPVLARGRSGLVFQARSSRDGRDVALKVLWPEFSQDETEVKRFVRAMRTMIPLRHPHLVGLYNAGKTGRYCWIAMERVEGESVAEVLRQAGGAPPSDWRFALRVATHVSRALAFAHYHHIIHRDITPQNILVRAADGAAKLGDLMLAKALEGGLAATITRPGELLGEVRYLSPERTAGGSTAVDGRADLYSLGATAYALVAGRPPLEAESPVRTILKIRQEKPASPKKAQPALPDRFEAAIMKLLAKRPEDRFPTAAALLAELEQIARAQAVGV
jgi:serine/threonine protein kinase